MSEKWSLRRSRCKRAEYKEGKRDRSRLRRAADTVEDLVEDRVGLSRHVLVT